MLKAISTFVYVKERLHPGLLDGLVRGGAQTIEIFAARQHLDYANRKQHVREIADWFRTSGMYPALGSRASLCRLRMGTNRGAPIERGFDGPGEPDCRHG